MPNANYNFSVTVIEIIAEIFHMHVLHRANVHICMNASTRNYLSEMIILLPIAYKLYDTIACAEQNSLNAMLPVMFVLNLLRGYVFALNQYIHEIIESVN